MAYNDLIDRTGASALMPEDVSREIIQGVAEQSAVLSLARRLPDMSNAQRRLLVLSALPTAYFVDGDTGLKQTANVEWGNKYINASEIACIVPIPEAVLDDASYDIWGEIRPLLMEEFGRVIDAAVIHGTNAPATQPDDIVTAATAAGNVVDYSTQELAGDDLYNMVMGEVGLISLVEQDGFMVNGHYATIGMRGRYRGLRDTTGQPIFVRTMQETAQYELDGEPMYFSRNGALDATAVLQVTGDWSKLVYSVRQDMTYTIATEGVIQDAAGTIVYNLFQQDMVALRAVMRLGWQVPNPINRVQETEASRYPFSVLIP